MIRLWQSNAPRCSHTELLRFTGRSSEASHRWRRSRETRGWRDARATRGEPARCGAAQRGAARRDARLGEFARYRRYGATPPRILTPERCVDEASIGYPALVTRLLRAGIHAGRLDAGAFLILMPLRWSDLARSRFYMNAYAYNLCNRIFIYEYINVYNIYI